MVLVLHRYHETVLIRLTSLIPTVRAIYLLPSLPPQYSILRVLKRFFLSFASLMSIILNLISAGTYKHGGFCLRLELPGGVNPHFLLNEYGDLFL